MCFAHLAIIDRKMWTLTIFTIKTEGFNYLSEKFVWLLPIIFIIHKTFQWDGPHILQIVLPIFIFHFNKFGHWSQLPLLHSFFIYTKVYWEKKHFHNLWENQHFPTHSGDLWWENVHEFVKIYFLIPTENRIGPRFEYLIHFFHSSLQNVFSSRNYLM